MSTICVHGLGYVGLPTAAMFANYDHEVVGYDTNDEIIAKLQEGDIHLDEPGLRAFVTQAIESGNLTVSNEVVQARNHIICVPTPFAQETKTADLDYVEAAGEAIASRLRAGDTVILESTVPPGTTVNVLQPVLERSGLDAGDDFALVHCPETVLPGNTITELKENSRIIGGVNEASTETAVDLYRSFVEGDTYTTDATTAEFVKLSQNTFRDVNIALANELAKIANEYDIDSREAIRLANKHPRVDIHQPGPGVGGHCVPIDPWFLGQHSDQLDLIEVARRINDDMPRYVIEILQRELGSLSRARIAILGVAYKGNVSDIRGSPGLNLARALQTRENKAGAIADGGPESPASTVDIAIHDPHVTDSLLDISSLKNAIDGADATIITTDHNEFADLDPDFCKEQMSGNVVIDTKAILDRSEWEEAGFNIRVI